MSDNDALIRLMELSGLKDAARSNEKLSEMWPFGKKSKPMAPVKEVSGFAIRNLKSSGVKCDANIVSRRTGGEYHLSVEGYGDSASRSGSDEILYARLKVSKEPKGNEDYNGLAIAASNVLRAYLPACQAKAIEVDGTDDENLEPVYRIMNTAVQNYKGPTK